MGTLTNTCAVKRTSLSLGDLNLNDGTNFVIVGFAMGKRGWVHYSESGSDVHGEIHWASRLARADRGLIIRVLGSTMPAFAANGRLLVTAFSQQSYEVVGSIDGVNVDWTDCWPAELDPVARGPVDGSSLDKFQLMARRHDLLLSIPSGNPVPPPSTWPW